MFKSATTCLEFMFRKEDYTKEFASGRLHSDGLVNKANDIN